ncbi:DNA/RNA nuclease SfsA [Thalassotalea mangrovi]|uniref:Sugar fermentation stimulation protein homolog n=1 Tax=Thalassotalea mangrovi TaxID=2572245 RepID=A0A4V5NU86_9GAMM|nr:DNA/RNA nuclease SfsA [Thalassotalea mangrovi]TKB45355.1 DNA/RNA nuclease SfsA [Thalassotalea mangrovi]
MKFSPPLKSATLIKRYKRFLADIELDDGNVLTIHCPNTGAMTGCADPGFKVWYSTSANKNRKYPQTFELAQNNQNHWIGVNTGNANKLVVEAINDEVISELTGYQHCQTEVKYGEEGSRIDVMLTGPGRSDCYVEVKSTTLLIEGTGYFPDAITTRGQKHIRELMAVKRQGNRAMLFFCVQHTGIENVSVADFIDADYAALLKQAVAAGVEIVCYGCDIDNTQIKLVKKLKFALP